MSNVQTYKGNKPAGLTPAERKQKGEELVMSLEKMKPKFQAVLPEHVPVERFIRTCASVITQDNDLLMCEPKSIFQAALTAAELGLEPNKNLGQAYFVQFRDNKAGVIKCQLIPGYQGYIKLARNSGEINSLNVHVVHQNDDFHWDNLNPENNRHIPELFGEPGPMIGAYIVAIFKDGSRHLDFMSKREIDKVRDSSKAKNFGPWKDWYEEMAKKTVVRRNRKYLPQAVYKATVVENAYLAGKEMRRDEFGILVDVEEEPTPEEEATPETSSRLDDLAQTFDTNQGQAPPVDIPPQGQPAPAQNNPGQNPPPPTPQM